MNRHSRNPWETLPMRDWNEMREVNVAELVEYIAEHQFGVGRASRIPAAAPALPVKSTRPVNQAALTRAIAGRLPPWFRPLLATFSAGRARFTADEFRDHCHAEGQRLAHFTVRYYLGLLVREGTLIKPGRACVYQTK